MHKSKQVLALLSLALIVMSCQQTQDSSLPESVTKLLAEENRQEEPSESLQHVLIFGDSITAGYGLEIEQAFPALIQEKIDAREWPFRVTNAGLSGETSSGGLNRINWLLRQPVDVFILELGGNDGLRGISPDLTQRNLQSIIDLVREANPEATIIVAGMQIPPNLGSAYTSQFKNIFPSLAEANDADLIPFILDGVGGIPRLNLPDGIHPTAEGHSIVAENVWEVLESILIERMNAS